MKRFLAALVLLATITFAAEANKEVFKVKTASGKELTFKGTDSGVITSPYEGKIVFLEFWGTWCGPCLLSIPHHVKLQDMYKNDLKIVAIETTPKVTPKELLEYKTNASKSINLSKVQWYLDNKAKDPRAKAYLKGPVSELEEFVKSGKNLNYDLVTSKDAGDFLYYISQRAQWRGGIPFLIILDKKGDVADVVQGMPTEDRLLATIKRILDKEKGIKHNRD
jgi:thiol-disulfide isomerase/thioredoxin